MNRRYMRLEAWERGALSAYAQAQKEYNAGACMAAAWEVERSAYYALWLVRAGLTAVPRDRESRLSRAEALRHLRSSTAASPIENRLCALFAD